MAKSRPSALRPKPPTSLTLLDACADPDLFAHWFSRHPEGWTAWFAFMRALFGLPLNAEQRRIYCACTGRTDAPDTAAREVYLICGRRSGKSFILALIAVWLACFHNYRGQLAPGERGTIFIVASDRKQARVILRYVTALLNEVSALRHLVTRSWNEGYDLSTGISIEVGTASHRSLRGYAIVAGLLDEAAFFTTDEESASPDAEIVTAIKPGMAQFSNSMLLVASSPYARRGILWDAHRNHHGRNGDPILVWQAATRVMNPSVPQSIIDEAMAKDSSAAAAEWLARFRDDIEGYISADAVYACVAVGIHERPPEARNRYVAFADPAGGSGKDSFTLAIAHKDKVTGLAVLDAVREIRPPFSPEAAVGEISALLKAYGIRTATGDKFAGAWPVESFKRHGIEYVQSAAPKSELYLNFLPLLNSKRTALLDCPRLASQLTALERRTSRSGKDSIDHPPGAHDDVANAVAGALSTLTAKLAGYDTSLRWVGSPMSDFQVMRRNFHMGVWR